MTGAQKKMLILDTLTKVINEQYINSENSLDKQLLFMLIDSILPHMIDTLVSSINGDNKFSKSIKSSKSDKKTSSISKLFCCK